ncbi:hypothetical protein [Paenibacillus sp. GCM10027626]|uniref:hypothetical protein n=1 Tax=Paenibacillus sp. GCM10027626 TaxID=3273411 RepID=UPI0036274F91
MLNKKILLTTSAAMLASVVVGASVWASIEKNDFTPTELVNGHKVTTHVNNHESFQERNSPELYKSMMEKWERAKEIAINDIMSRDAAIMKEIWTIVPSTDIDLELTNHLSKEESNSFKDALFSDERKNNISVGDYMPAVLLNEKKDRAILTWLKGTGETVVIDIKSKKDESGNRIWYIDGKAKIKK